MKNIVRDVRFWIAVGLLSLLTAVWLTSGLLRVGSPPEPLGFAARALTLIVIAILATGIFFVAKLASGKANRQVLDEIAGSGGGNGSDSKLTEEEQQLQNKFREASTRISRMRFGKVGSRKHLYQLPWYIVIGSPGSGKTTAIRQSGLEFPLDDITQGGSLGGVGGTRNCDWWVTGQAVLLDTAGRYTTQDSDTGKDARGWKNFLSLLRKHRKRQPVNGAILVISTEELLHMSDEQWKNHSRIVTRRLHELADELQMSFPVYMVVTKVDLLAGCREFFDYLESDEQEQIWGTTLAQGEPITVIGDQLTGLARRLHEQLPSKLRNERDVRRRRAIYSFPWQFEAIGSRISQLAEQVFSHHTVVDSATLRGVYFSSAVQEGTPIERLVGSVATGFGISGGQLSTDTGRSRSLFLRRLFPDVVFREAFLAGINTGHVRNMQRLRLATFVGIILAGIGIAVVWSSAFGIHRALLAQSRDELALFDQTEHGTDRTLSQNLTALQYLEQSTEVFSQREHPWLSSLGMYENSIDEASQEAYIRAVGALIAPAAGRGILDALDAYRNLDFQSRFNALKAYLMLANAERRDPEWLLSWVASSQVGEFQGKTAELAAAHLGNLFDAAPDHELAAVDVTVVEANQRRLARVALSRQLYSALLADYEAEYLDFTEELGPYFPVTFELQDSENVSVPFPFTLEGYRATSFGPQATWVRNWLSDRWVLGEQPSLSPMELKREIEAAKRLYAQDYINTWTTLLQEIELSNVSGDRLNTVLRHMSEPALSPETLLLELLVRQTQLPESEAMGAALELAQQAAERRSSALSRNRDRLAALAPDIPNFSIPEAIADAFLEYRYMTDGGAGSKQARVAREIGEVRQWLSRSDSSRAGEGDDPVEQLLLTSEELQPPFSEWVAELAYAARDSAGANRLGRINALWKQNVTVACLDSFRGRFPFFSQSGADVPVAAFDRFFRPGGIENAFVEQYLAPLLSGESSLLSKGTRWTMRQGDRIRNAFFSNGNELGFDYALTGVDVDDRIGQLIIESGDEQAVRYRHGPPIPLYLKWPDGPRGIRITYMLRDGSRQMREIEGPWAIFRLAEESAIGRTAGGKGMLLSLGHKGYRAIFRITADTQISPFSPGLLSKYQCRDTP